MSDLAARSKVLTFRPEADSFDAMTALRRRDGVPFSEQIRRALRSWLTEKGVLVADTPQRETKRRTPRRPRR